MTNLTEETIAGIKAATEGAQGGPWQAMKAKAPVDGEYDFALSAEGASVFAEVFGRTSDGGRPPASATAYFIANCDPQTISALCDLALRGLAPLPEGYALVPIEPTGEMWVAGRKAYEADAEKYRAADTTAMAMAHADRAPEHIYRAMIAASPAIPTARDGGATHRHKKRGTEYVLLGIGKMQADGWIDDTRSRTGVQQDGPHVTRYREVSSVDMREVAVYRSADDVSLWVRPREEFEDGRFEALSNGAQP